jgi:hypothetical protein
MFVPAAAAALAMFVNVGWSQAPSRSCSEAVWMAALPGINR